MLAVYLFLIASKEDLLLWGRMISAELLSIVNLKHPKAHKVGYKIMRFLKARVLFSLLLEGLFAFCLFLVLF